MGPPPSALSGPKSPVLLGLSFGVNRGIRIPAIKLVIQD